MLNAIVIGVSIGIISGMIGIGGGPILIPLLLYVFHLDMKSAAGTSLAIIIPTALVGVISHSFKGNVDIRLALIIAAGGMVGAFLGSFMSPYVPEDVLKKMFALLLIYIALRILFGDQG